MDNTAAFYKYNDTKTNAVSDIKRHFFINNLSFTFFIYRPGHEKTAVPQSKKRYSGKVLS